MLKVVNSNPAIRVLTHRYPTFLLVSLYESSGWQRDLALVGSVAEGFAASFYDGHDRKVDGSTPTKASLLRPWIRCFTTIISAWWNLTSSKLK